jgi:hypothetical protein
MTSHVPWENTFEVMYTRVQVQYKAEKIMEFVLVTPVVLFLNLYQHEQQSECIV